MGTARTKLAPVACRQAKRAFILDSEHENRLRKNAVGIAWERNGRQKRIELRLAATQFVLWALHSRFDLSRAAGPDPFSAACAWSFLVAVIGAIIVLALYHALVGRRAY